MEFFYHTGGRIASRLCSCVLLIVALLGGQVQGHPIEIAALNQPVDLSGNWKFSPGDNPAWANPGFDDQTWKTLQVPGSWTDQG